MEAVSLQALLDNRDKLLKDLPLLDTDPRIRPPIFLTELIAVACLIGLLITCLRVNRLEDFKIWGLEAWRWWMLLFVIVVGGMAVRLLMDVVLVSLDHANSALRRRIQAKIQSQIQAKISEEAKKISEKAKINEKVQMGDEIKSQIDHKGNEIKLQIDHKGNDLEDWPSILRRKKLELGENVLKLVEKVLDLGEKVSQVVGGCRGSIQAIFWIGFILIAWILLFRMGVKLPEHRSSIMNKVTQGLAGLLIGTVLWLFKTVWLQLLAFSLIFEERSKEKIKQAQEDQKCLNELWKTVLDLAEEMGNGNDKTKVLPQERKLIKKDRQWTPESIIRKIAGTSRPVLVEDKEDADNVQRAARVTAGWLFEMIKAICGVENSVSENHKRKTKFIIMKECQKYEELQKKLEKVSSGSRSFDFIIERSDKAKKKVRSIAKKDRIRRLRKSELEGWLEKIYIDRIVLLRTVNGWDDIVCELNRIVSVMLFVVNIVVWLFVTGLLTTTVAIAIAAQVIAFNFMFGTSARTTFKAFFFVFKSQPFAVGDRCKIVGEDFEMVVHDMNFLSTIFTSSDGEKIYYPNSVLVDKNIDNFFSVPDTRDVIEFFVDLQEKEKKLQGDGNDVAETTRQMIKEEIDKFLGEREKKWTKDFNVEIYELSKEKTIHIVILTVNHKVNFCNCGDKAKHRDKLLRELHYILHKELKIVCIDCNSCREALNLPKRQKNGELVGDAGN